MSEGGREIVLYRVSAGESCALTTACLMGYEEYLAEGIAETAVRAVAIPRSLFDELIPSSRDFRRFLFTAFSRRATNLFRIIEDVAFACLDAPLVQRLLQLARRLRDLRDQHLQIIEGGVRLSMTHFFPITDNMVCNAAGIAATSKQLDLRQTPTSSGNLFKHGHALPKA